MSFLSMSRLPARPPSIVCEIPADAFDSHHYFSIAFRTSSTSLMSF
jgi:hypothetical protein